MRLNEVCRSPNHGWLVPHVQIRIENGKGGQFTISNNEDEANCPHSEHN
jgi:hypothetical protein